MITVITNNVVVKGTKKTEYISYLSSTPFDLTDNCKERLVLELERLDHAIHSYINHATNMKNVDELSALVQDAYTRLNDIVYNDQHFRNLRNSDRENIIDLFENAIMTQNHKYFFFDPVRNTPCKCIICGILLYSP